MSNFRMRRNEFKKKLMIFISALLIFTVTSQQAEPSQPTRSKVICKKLIIGNKHEVYGYLYWSKPYHGTLLSVKVPTDYSTYGG